MRRKILLTGSTGMVGRNLLEHPGSEDFYWLVPCRQELDLLDRSAVAKYLVHNKPDLVIHAAARVGGIQANLRQPVEFLIDNWDMSRNVIVGSHEAGIPRLINIASSCMYPRNSATALREDEILTGKLEPTNEGYAIAKIAALKLCQYIAKSHRDRSYKTVIPCNIYGRWDHFNSDSSHLLAAIISKTHAAISTRASTIEIWGDGEARREFMYASDLADFLIFAIDRLEVLPDTLNIGVGVDFTVNEYYKMTASVLGYSGGYRHNLDKPVGMDRKLIDVSRAKALGWCAKTSMAEGISKTYSFYMEHMK